MFQSGQQIGNYVLVQRIGRGGFGEVWLAERRAKFVTTKVAVKLPLDDQVEIETIKQEASLWEKASGHPNVLPIIDADEYNGQIVIVSEYAPDGSLEQLLKEKGNLPVEQAVEMVIGILAGLQFLHSRNIIHRDIKPANILLQGDTPRLADFGISRAMMTTSMSVNVAGTPIYMSPEAFDGKRNVQTDIWSVGVILYQLVSGKLPFPQNSQGELLAAIIMREPEPLPLNFPAELRRIIGKALAKNPAERYHSAQEMQKDLMDFRSAPLQVSQPTFVQKPPPIVNPTVVQQTSVQHTIPTAEEKVKPKSNRIFIIGGVAAAIFVVALIGAAGIGLLAYYYSDKANKTDNIKIPPLPANSDQSKTTTKSPEANTPWVYGNPSASVMVEIFSDLQCPTCASLEKNVLKEIKSTYKDRVRFVFRHYPLTMIHNKANDAALATEAAGLQGKFWEMQDYLYAKQEVWVAAADHRQLFADYAKAIGLDVAKFEKDFTASVGKSRIEADKERGKSLNVTQTPSVFVNGENIPFENLKIPHLKQILDDNLAKK